MILPTKYPQRTLHIASWTPEPQPAPQWLVTRTNIPAIESHEIYLGHLILISREGSNKAELRLKFLTSPFDNEERRLKVAEAAYEYLTPLKLENAKLMEGFTLDDEIAFEVTLAEDTLHDYSHQAAWLAFLLHQALNDKDGTWLNTMKTHDRLQYHFDHNNGAGDENPSWVSGAELTLHQLEWKTAEEVKPDTWITDIQTGVFE